MSLKNKYLLIPLKKVSLILLFLIQGCSYQVYTKPLEKPVDLPAASYFSLFDVSLMGVRMASIGEELFRIKRYVAGEIERINYISPTAQPFPKDGIWKGTHVFNDGSSGDCIVYTHSSYHGGSMGVILNEELLPATRKSLVQLNGRKEGKRWWLHGRGEFFYTPDRLVDYWGLRYGGLSGDKYIFEIVKKSESETTEILQSIKIAESNFLAGFTVRGVRVRGLEKDKQGVIKFEISDQLQENQTQKLN